MNKNDVAQLWFVAYKRWKEKKDMLVKERTKFQPTSDDLTRGSERPLLWAAALGRSGQVARAGRVRGYLSLSVVLRL